MSKITESIKILEKEGYKVTAPKEISREDWLDIPELGISVEIDVHDKDKSWDELSLKDREDELLDIEQCIFLSNNNKYSKILKMDGSSTKDDFFIKQPFELNRKNGYVAWFYVISGGANLGCWVDSDGSYSTLGVRFCRKKIFKKTK